MDLTKYFSCIVSGIITTAIFQPVDALRTRYFFGNPTFRLSALYNGFVFNTGTSVLKLSASYPTQEFISERLPISPLYRESISGLIAGLTLSLVSTPINTIKIPLMANAQNNVFSVTKQIYSGYGLTGFYRGGIGTLMRDGVWNGIYFPIFYKLNERLENRFISSTLAGAFALCFSYPFDGIRMYRQNDKQNYNFWYGFKYSFNRSPENLKSFAICMTRVPLYVASSHYIYLFSNDFIKSLR